VRGRIEREFSPSSPALLSEDGEKGAVVRA
jgi:hypothetical protein